MWGHFLSCLRELSRAVFNSRVLRMKWSRLRYTFLNCVEFSTGMFGLAIVDPGPLPQILLIFAAQGRRTKTSRDEEHEVGRRGVSEESCSHTTHFLLCCAPQKSPHGIVQHHGCGHSSRPPVAQTFPAFCLVWFHHMSYQLESILA